MVVRRILNRKNTFSGDLQGMVLASPSPKTIPKRSYLDKGPTQEQLERRQNIKSSLLRGMGGDDNDLEGSFVMESDDSTNTLISKESADKSKSKPSTSNVKKLREKFSITKSGKDKEFNNNNNNFNKIIKTKSKSYHPRTLPLNDSNVATPQSPTRTTTKPKRSKSVGPLSGGGGRQRPTAANASAGTTTTTTSSAPKRSQSYSSKATPRTRLNDLHQPKSPTTSTPKRNRSLSQFFGGDKSGHERKFSSDAGGSSSVHHNHNNTSRTTPRRTKSSPGGRLKSPGRLIKSVGKSMEGLQAMRKSLIHQDDPFMMTPNYYKDSDDEASDIDDDDDSDDDIRSFDGNNSPPSSPYKPKGKGYASSSLANNYNTKLDMLDISERAAKRVLERRAQRNHSGDSHSLSSGVKSLQLDDEVLKDNVDLDGNPLSLGTGLFSRGLQALEKLYDGTM